MVVKVVLEAHPLEAHHQEVRILLLHLLRVLHFVPIQTLPDHLDRTVVYEDGLFLVH